MPDPIARTLARYAAGAGGLPETSLHEVERRILDSIGVAIAASAEPAVSIARTVAAGNPGRVTVWDTEIRTNPATAAFANGVAVRARDFNDTHLSKEPLHPSDAIAPLLALAEARGLDGLRVIEAIAISYEVGIALCDAASFRERGWDHVNVLGVAVACGAGRLLALPVERIEQAVSITSVPHAAMRQTRLGGLSMWKGAAAANAARNAVFATLLAEAGMSGPELPFEGEMGLVHQLLDGAFDRDALEPLDELQPPRRIFDTHVKRWPVEYHAQSAVSAALQVRADLGDPIGIEQIQIQTFRAAYEIIAADPEKWDPLTRETADHSLPYVVCAALQDGRVDLRTFDPARIRRSDTLALLREATTVEVDDALTAGYPRAIPSRVVVTTGGGKTIAAEVEFPSGHARNAMSDAEIVGKFRSNVAERWDDERASRVEDAAWRLHETGGIDRLLEGLRR